MTRLSYEDPQIFDIFAILSFFQEFNISLEI